MDIKYIKAKSISYGKERDLSKIKYIVIHNTGNKNDRAESNARYFSNSNTRQAGAHFFVDQQGEIYKSVPLSLTAWSVGGVFDSKVASVYKKCTNENSISIELCDIVDKYPSDKMIEAVKDLIVYLKKVTKNNKLVIVRHWDVNGKTCPLLFIGKKNKKWIKFKSEITSLESKVSSSSSSYSSKSKYKRLVRIKVDTLNVRNDASLNGVVVGQVHKNEVYTIVDLHNKWGKLKSGLGWIHLDYTDEI